MRLKRPGKEIKFTENEFTIKYGTLNQYMPDIIYLRGKTRIIPNKRMDYTERVKKMRKQFIETVTRQINFNNNFTKQHIIQFATNENGLTYNKVSILKFEIYLKPLTQINFIDYLPSIKIFSSQVCLKLKNILRENSITIKS